MYKINKYKLKSSGDLFKKFGQVMINKSDISFLLKSNSRNANCKKLTTFRRFTTHKRSSMLVVAKGKKLICSLLRIDKKGSFMALHVWRLDKSFFKLMSKKYIMTLQIRSSMQDFAVISNDDLR